MLRSAAALALAPVLVRADCPCGQEILDAQKPAPAAPPATQPAEPITTLRVCADPANLPFSNREHEGFEDKIAALVAKDLNLPLEYEWLPQRLGFYRTALKSRDANLVMAAPAGFEKALVSDPYYRSSYVFVQRKDRGDPIRSFDDAALKTAKIGIPLTNGQNTPPSHALAKRNLIDNVTGYSVFDETEGRPGERLIGAVASGEIDVAIAWGPQAGYFATRQSVPLEVVPVSPAEESVNGVSLPFTFAICMALRRPDKALRARVNDVIRRQKPEIDRILAEYAVPCLPVAVAAAGGTGFGGKHD